MIANIHFLCRSTLDKVSLASGHQSDRECIHYCCILCLYLSDGDGNHSMLHGIMLYIEESN